MQTELGGEALCRIIHRESKIENPMFKYVLKMKWNEKKNTLTITFDDCFAGLPGKLNSELSEINRLN